jgi:hypothetical protein
MENTIEKEPMKKSSDLWNLGWGFLSFLFPLSGLIWWQMWKNEKPLRAKACAEGVLNVTILISIFTPIGIGLLSTYFNSTGLSGERILIVHSVAENSREVSEKEVIQKALSMGGYISVNVDALRAIEPSFDALYTVLNSNRQFMILPAILNFVGGNGWHFVQTAGQDYIFVKSSDEVYSNIISNILFKRERFGVGY